MAGYLTHNVGHFSPYQLSHTSQDGLRTTFIPPLTSTKGIPTTTGPGLHPQLPNNINPPNQVPSNDNTNRPPETQNLTSLGKFGLEDFAHFLHAFHTHYNNPSGSQSDDPPGTTHPHFDLAETKSGYTIYGELAGLERKDVTVETNDLMFTITISGVLRRGLPEHETKKSPPAEAHPEYFDHRDEEFEGGKDLAAEPPLHWHIAERHVGKFSRAFHLPFGSANMAVVNATMKDGLLVVTVPKTVAEMYREGVAGRKVEVGVRQEKKEDVE